MLKKKKEGGKGIEALRKKAPEVVARMGYGLGGLISRSVNALISKRQKLIDKAYKTNTKSKEIKDLEKKITQAQKKYNKEIERNEEGFGPEEDYFGENSIESEFEFEMTVGSSQEQIDEILVALMPKADRAKYNELTELINFKKERLSKRDYDMDDSDFNVMDGPDPLGFRSFKAGQRKAVRDKAETDAINEQERLAEESYYSRIEGGPDDDIPFAEGGKVMKPAKTRYTYAEGKEVDKQMVGLGISVSPITAEMQPDEEMEDGYMDFIIDQSLSPEEQKFLMDKLESEPKLSIVFDKVMDTATEFSGSGPVDGPGSGVSDSIPARLSDGEFVFTAKATDQIGADRLQSMMKDAEMQADAGRQEMQEGGEVEEKQMDEFGKAIDEDIAKDEVRKDMMSTNPRLQQK